MTYFQVESPNEVTWEETLRKVPNHLPGKNSSILTAFEPTSPEPVCWVTGRNGGSATCCLVWCQLPGVSPVWTRIQLCTVFCSHFCLYIHIKYRFPWKWTPYQGDSPSSSKNLWIFSTFSFLDIWKFLWQSSNLPGAKLRPENGLPLTELLKHQINNLCAYLY